MDKTLWLTFLGHPVFLVNSGGPRSTLWRLEVLSLKGFVPCPTYGYCCCGYKVCQNQLYLQAIWPQFTRVPNRPWITLNWAGGFRRVMRQQRCIDCVDIAGRSSTMGLQLEYTLQSAKKCDFHFSTSIRVKISQSNTSRSRVTINRQCLLVLVVVRRFRRRRCTDVVVCGTVISGHEGDCGDQSPKHRFCRSEDRQVQLE